MSPRTPWRLFYSLRAWIVAVLMIEDEDDKNIFSFRENIWKLGI